MRFKSTSNTLAIAIIANQTIFYIILGWRKDFFIFSDSHLRGNTRKLFPNLINCFIWIFEEF